MEIENQKIFLYNRITAEAKGFDLLINMQLSDRHRPWGAFIRFENSSMPAFLDAYWKGTSQWDQLRSNENAPKILLVAPGAKLSLQWHNRRKEFWRVLVGPVKVVIGEDGATLQERVMNTGDIIEIPQGYWHRLAGCGNWGIIAEIWQHTVAANPSDEEDIVRIEDDYARLSAEV